MPKIEFEKVQNLVIKQNEHITLFHSDTPESLLDRVSEEVEELREAIKKETEDVESEIGDVTYLLIRLSQLTGIDLIEAVLSKIARNYQKYGKAESREQAKANWSHEKDQEYLSKWILAFREKQRKIYETKN